MPAMGETGIPGLCAHMKIPRPCREMQLVKKTFLTSWWTGEQAPPPLPPLPVSAEILRISGRGNCKEAIFALENGIFRRGVLRAHAPLLLYKSPKTEAASRGAGQLIAKVVQWKGNGLTDHPKSFALATESVSQPSIVQRSICAGRVPSGTLESANR